MEAYTVPGWPSVENGHSAVMPHMNRLAGSGALQYKDGVTGEPGTWQAPVSSPGIENSRTAQAMMGLSRSPDGQGFRPNLYWARPERSFWPGAGQPIALRDESLMPVPAVDPRGVPARLATPVPLRYNKQIGWVPVLPRWASVTQQGQTGAS